MNVESARVHLAEARDLLRLEAYRCHEDGSEESMPDFTLAEELDRIDRALGPTGQSMFGPIADKVRQAYVEIRAAMQCLA